MNGLNKLYYNEKYKEVKTQLDDYIEEHPNSVNAWCYLGTVLRDDLGDTTGAVNAFNSALNIEADHYNSIIGLGIIQRMYGNYDKAKAFYKLAIDINSRNPVAYGSLVVLELKNRNMKEAIRYGEKAKSLNIIKNNLVILSNLAIAYHYDNQIEKRNKILMKLEEDNYRDLKYIKMIINGEIDIIDYL